MSFSRPLSELPGDVCRGLKGLLTDLDDTLTTDGVLTPSAFTSLAEAAEAGLLTVIVTGRPAGWADHIARMWPVHGVVAENGAMYLRHVDGKMIKKTVDEADRGKLDQVAQDILARVPGTALASDQAYREFDVAIDYCEDVEPLSAEAVDEIARIFEEHGATCKISSIHVNGWFGSYDKLGMLKRLLLDEFGQDLEHAGTRSEFAYVGDSPNDQPMFAFFEHSVGVANIDDFAEHFETPPQYRTSKRAGAGFSELVDTLLRRRS